MPKEKKRTRCGCETYTAFGGIKKKDFVGVLLRQRYPAAQAHGIEVFSLG